MENTIGAISQSINIFQAKKCAWNEYHAITIHGMNNVQVLRHIMNIVQMVIRLPLNEKQGENAMEQTLWFNKKKMQGISQQGIDGCVGDWQLKAQQQQIDCIGTLTNYKLK